MGTTFEVGKGGNETQGVRGGGGGGGLSVR